MNERPSLKFVKSGPAPSPCQAGPRERSGTCLAPFMYDFTIPFVQTHRTISMKYGIVTGESEAVSNENHENDKAFFDDESTVAADADCSLRASGVCRNLRGRAVRGGIAIDRRRPYRRGSNWSVPSRINNVRKGTKYRNPWNSTMYVFGTSLYYSTVCFRSTYSTANEISFN